MNVIAGNAIESTRNPVKFEGRVRAPSPFVNARWSKALPLKPVSLREPFGLFVRVWNKGKHQQR